MEKKDFVDYYNFSFSSMIQINSIFPNYFEQLGFKDILIRYSELGTKSQQVQHRMEMAFLNSIKIQLRKFYINYTNYTYERGRIIFSFNKDDIQLACYILIFTPGVFSISPIYKTNSDLEYIIKKTISFVSKILKPTQSIGINVRILKKDFPHSSKEISLKCFNKILSLFKNNNKISFNLHNPDLKIYIEIRDKFAYIYSLKLKGFFPGLPIEKQRISPAICLYRPNDFYAMIRIIQRGQHILPIIFKLRNINYYSNLTSLWQILKINYPISEFYAIELDIRSLLEKYKKLFKEEICLFCRYIRFRSIILIKTIQKKYILKLIRKDNLFIKKDSNILYEIPKKHIKTRFLRGIVDGEGEGIYCPNNPIIWKQNLMFDEIIIQPNISITKEEILNHFQIWIESINNFRELILQESNLNKNQDKIYYFKNFNLIYNENIFNYKICDFKSESSVDMFNNEEILKSFQKKLENIKNLDEQIINILYQGKLTKIF